MPNQLLAGQFWHIINTHNVPISAYGTLSRKEKAQDALHDAIYDKETLSPKSAILFNNITKTR